MLTRDLLRYRVAGDRVEPVFLLEDARALRMATEICDVIRARPGSTRGAIDNALAHAVGASHAPEVARGLAKLLLDRCTFADAPPDAAVQRLGQFESAAQHLRGLPSAAQAPAMGAYAAGLPAWHQPYDLYADLPDQRPLTAVRPLTAAALVRRYNVAQVQGLVLLCERVALTVADSYPRLTREILRWLKFCRLVAHVRRSDGGAWHMDITGPTALFTNAKQYGLQLAMFVSAVFRLPRFALEAHVALRRGLSKRLVLSEASGLHGLQAGGAQVAPELALLDDPQAYLPWQPDAAAMPRPVGLDGMLVPDLVLRHPDGRAVWVELFHRWHRHALVRRLGHLRERFDAAVLLGVDRALTRAVPEVSAVQAFTFNDFPTRKKLRDALSGLTPQCGGQDGIPGAVLGPSSSH